MAKTDEVKKIEAKEGLLVYLNPSKSVMFVDEQSGLKLGFFDGWNESAPIPKVEKDKLSVIQKALDLEILLTSQPKTDGRQRSAIVEDDPALSVEANKLLSAHPKMLALDLKEVKSKDLVEIMIRKEKRGENRDAVIDLLNKHLSMLEGEKTIIDNDKAEAEFEIKNIEEK